MNTHILRFLRAGLAALAALIAPAHAQLADRATNDQACDRLLKLYNEGNYAGIHGMLSPAFQKSMNLEATDRFFRGQVAAPCGKFLSITYQDQKDGAMVYAVKAEKAWLTLTLFVDQEKRIAGMTFRPGQPPASVTPARPAPPTDNPRKSALDQRVHAAVSSYHAGSQVSAVVVGILQGTEKTLYHYGETARGNGHLPAANTIFEIGSITKTFTSLLLAQAVERKEIRLDADIRLLLGGAFPNLESAREPVRIVHLANHTSGLPRLPDDLASVPGFNLLQPYQHYDWKRMEQFLHKVKPTSAPATRYEYSNLGAAVLGHILEKTCRTPYANLISTRITGPLGMRDTGLKVADEARFARGYREDGTETPPWVFGDWAPAGGVCSTLNDMLLYMGVHLHPGSATVRLVLQKTTALGGGGVGLAWHFAMLPDGEPLIWHNGGTAGFSSFCGFIPGRNFGVVVLANSASRVDDVALTLLRGGIEK